MTSNNILDEDISYIVDRHRSPYESREEWDLRRSFMIANFGKVNMESLVCLANCYLNVEMYGCKYPVLVMEKIREMSNGVIARKPSTTENLPRRMKGLETVKFVKQSDTQSTDKTAITSSGKSAHQTTNSNNAQKAANQKTVAPSFHFVKASTEFHSTDVASESAKQRIMRKNFQADCQPQPVIHQNVSAQNMLQKTGLGFSKKGKSAEVVHPEIPTNSFLSEVDNQFHSFANHFAAYKKKHTLRSPVDIFHMVAMKTKMKIDTQFSDKSVKGQHRFTCTVVIDNVEVATGEDSNKKGAKNRAFEIGQEKMSRKFIKVVRVNPEKQELQSFDEEPESEPGFIAEEPAPMAPNAKACKRKESELHGDLTRFIVFETSNADQNAISILKTSSDMNHADLQYEFHMDMSGTRCRVTLDGHNLVEYMGTTKVSAKSVAAEKALERLKQICWTIKIKAAVDSTDSEINRDEVMGEIQKQVSSISDDNVGSRLLKKMGWTGGGVGAEGNKGLAEPVAVTMTNHVLLNRQGLGLHGDHAKAMVDFKKKITEVIDNYAKSERGDDLAFAPEFSKEERAFIHQYSQKLGLKTQSRGSGSERYLTISRKRSVSQLFEHIMEEGGSTHKYELIPPLYDS